MGTVSGIILIVLVLGIGGYCWFKQNPDQNPMNNNKKEQAESSSWKFWEKNNASDGSDGDNNTGQQAVGDQKSSSSSSWKFWEKNNNNNNNINDADAAPDEFHDEETPTKSASGWGSGKKETTPPPASQKGWMDSMADKMMEMQNNMPSANSMKMKMFKLSSGV